MDFEPTDENRMFREAIRNFGQMEVAPLGDEVRTEAPMVKLFTSELLQKILSDSMQIHGGYGYMMEYPIQRFWRDGRLFTITEGTSEIQRMVIASRLGF
jgi:alkylation response protein AidB-like acyl-CoA dehydrogenase